MDVLHWLWKLTRLSPCPPAPHPVFAYFIAPWTITEGVSEATMWTFTALLIRLICEVQRKESFIFQLLCQLRISGNLECLKGF